MPNWFYIDVNGQKQGPISDSQLKELATQGMIQPDTQLATDTGKRGTAGQIRGLFSVAASAPTAAQVPQQATAPAAEDDPWNWGGIPASEISSLVSQSHVQNAPQYQPSPKSAAPRRHSRGSGEIRTYLVWSIITTLCCFPLLGIPAIIFSVLCGNDLKTGNYDAAAKKSNIAFWCNLIGLILCVLLSIVQIAVVLWMKPSEAHQQPGLNPMVHPVASPEGRMPVPPPPRPAIDPQTQTDRARSAFSAIREDMNPQTDRVPPAPPSGSLRPDAKSLAAMTDAAHKLMEAIDEVVQKVQDATLQHRDSGIRDRYLKDMRDAVATYTKTVNAISLVGCSGEFKDAVTVWKQSIVDLIEYRINIAEGLGDADAYPEDEAEKHRQRMQELHQQILEKQEQFLVMCRNLGMDVQFDDVPSASPVSGVRPANPQPGRTPVSPTVRPTPGTLPRLHAFGPMRMLVSSVDRYNRDAGQYPTTEQGLAALLSRPSDVSNSRMTMPYVQERQLTDPWGNAYRYARPGKNGRSYDIWSVGPDGVDGTADDVGHWMEPRDL